jgi:hypothetical protein
VVTPVRPAVGEQLGGMAFVPERSIFYGGCLWVDWAISANRKTLTSLCEIQLHSAIPGCGESAGLRHDETHSTK